MTTLVGGLAVFLGATSALLMALRFPYVSYITRAKARFFAASFGLIGVSLSILHGVRATRGTSTPGEILGIAGGLTFVLAAVIAFRAASEKQSVA